MCVRLIILLSVFNTALMAVADENFANQIREIEALEGKVDHETGELLKSPVRFSLFKYVKDKGCGLDDHSPSKIGYATISLCKQAGQELYFGKSVWCCLKAD